MARSHVTRCSIRLLCLLLCHFWETLLVDILMIDAECIEKSCMQL